MFTVVSFVYGGVWRCIGWYGMMVLDEWLDRISYRKTNIIRAEGTNGGNDDVSSFPSQWRNSDFYEGNDDAQVQKKARQEMVCLISWQRRRRRNRRKLLRSG